MRQDSCITFTGLLKLSVPAVREQHVQQIVLEGGVAGEPFMGRAQREGKHQRKKQVIMPRHRGIEGITSQQRRLGDPASPGSGIRLA